MANQYATASPGTTPGVSYTPTKDWQYTTANWEKVKAQLIANGATPAQIEAALQEYRAAATEAYPGWKAAHVNQHFWQKPAFWATLPVAAYGGYSAYGALAGGGAEAAGAGGTAAGTAGTAGATGTTGATAAGVLPATATVPTATGTLAGLSGGTGLGTAAGVGAGAGSTAAGALGPSTAESMAATQAVAQGSTVPASLSSAGIPAGGSSSWLGGVGKFLGSNAGAATIGAGANLAGAAIQSSANTKAAEIAAQTAREALAYEKQRDTYAQQLEASRYGDLTSRLTPYISSGQNANARMAQILGLPAPDTAPMGTPPTPMGQTPPGTAIPQPGGSLVTMKAPDGSIKQIALDQVNHYLARGAQPVGNTYA